MHAGTFPWDLAGRSIVRSRVLHRGEPETRGNAHSKSPQVRETMCQDDVREYAVAYDDELVRREVGERRAGVGRLERGVERNGRAQVMGDGFWMQLGSIVARVRHDEDVRGAKGTQPLMRRPGQNVR